MGRTLRRREESGGRVTDGRCSQSTPMPPTRCNQAAAATLAQLNPQDGCHPPDNARAADRARLPNFSSSDGRSPYGQRSAAASWLARDVAVQLEQGELLDIDPSDVVAHPDAQRVAHKPGVCERVPG